MFAGTENAARRKLRPSPEQLVLRASRCLAVDVQRDRERFLPDREFPEVSRESLEVKSRPNVGGAT
jgi:hypothetical protein